MSSSCQSAGFGGKAGHHGDGEWLWNLSVYLGMESSCWIAGVDDEVVMVAG